VEQSRRFLGLGGYGRVIGRDDSLAVPRPFSWRDEPVKFPKLDSSRADWECRKVIGDVLLENRRYDMRNVRREHVPAQRTQCESGNDEDDEYTENKWLTQSGQCRFPARWHAVDQSV